MAKRFEEQVVWITGGGSGIGKALADGFAQEGATVVISGRRGDRLQEVAAELGEHGGQALAIACDVTDEAQIEASVRQIIDTYGRLDVAVANAGYAVAGRVEKLKAEEWRRQLDVNVVGLALTAKHAIPALRESKGRLVLVGSVAASIVTPGMAAYSASKFAVRAIGRTLSLELHGSGVSCTTIHPGYVESEIAQVDNAGVRDPSKDDNRPKRLMWSSERAARAMIDGIWRRKREFVFTGHGKIGAFVGTHMPGLSHFAQTRGSAH